MSRDSKSVRRFLLILLMLCATLSAQAASYAAEQETHHASDHCCRLCHLGPAPILPSAAVAMVAPVDAPVWLQPVETVRAPHTRLIASAGSRAPPA